MKHLKILIFIILLLLAPLVLMNLSDHSLIGEDGRGYVTRDIYAHYGDRDLKIAVVTGIHRGRLFPLHRSSGLQGYSPSYLLRLCSTP